MVKCRYHSFESYPGSIAAMIGLPTLKIIPIILAKLLELHILTLSILINLITFRIFKKFI